MSDGLKDALKDCNIISNYGHEFNKQFKEQIELKEGTKYDNGKPILALVPASLDEAVGDILTLGAKKYSPNNWKKGIDYTRIVSSLKRHLNQFYQGNLIDEESGKPHLHHAACNIAFLIEYEGNPEKYSKFNDLNKEDK